MTNPYENLPPKPPKPAGEGTPFQELPQREPPVPGAPAILEPTHERSHPNVEERVSVSDLTPEQAEQPAEMLRPIQNPAVNAARRQEAKDRQLLNPDRNGPVVPYTAEESARAEQRYDAGWQDPALPQGPEEVVAQKEREGLENLRKLVELMDEFELKYPLQELHAITNISLAELVEHPVRKPANIALVHIKKAMAVSPIEKMPEINERYRRLSRAVGNYNGISKTLDHDRG